MEVSAYLEAMGMTAESLAAEFREPAEQAVRVDLALRSVADAEGMNPDDEKLDEQLEEMAGMSGQSATELRERLAEVGQLSVLRADLGKQAAMEWLTENVELIDENGDPIDRATLEIPEEEADIGSDSAEIPGSPDSPDSVDSPDSEEE
jgi:trigger factor